MDLLKRIKRSGRIVDLRWTSPTIPTSRKKSKEASSSGIRPPGAQADRRVPVRLRTTDSPTKPTGELSPAAM